MATYLCVKTNNTTKKYEVKASANKPYMRVSTGYMPLTIVTDTNTGLRIKSGNNTYRIIESYTTTQTTTQTHYETKSTTDYVKTYGTIKYKYGTGQNMTAIAYFSKATLNIFTGPASSSYYTNASQTSVTGITAQENKLGTCTGYIYSTHYYYGGRYSYSATKYTSLGSNIQTTNFVSANSYTSNSFFYGTLSPTTFDYGSLISRYTGRKGSRYVTYTVTRISAAFENNKFTECKISNIETQTIITQINITETITNTITIGA